ncbi:MAG: hypothetical protein AB8C84_01170 [Oligoflexales bacterium]
MLDSLWQEKTASVVIVDPSEKISELHRVYVEEGGFSNIQCFSDIDDIVELIEKQAVDWLIMSSFSEKNLNILQILERTCKPGLWYGIRVTWLMDSSEDKDLLEQGISKGLFYAQKRMTKKDLVKKKWEDFFKKAEDCGWDRLKMSASLLRRVLRGDRGRLIKFEKNYQRILPADVDSWLSLIPVEAERTEEVSYAQLDLINIVFPNRSMECQDLKNRFKDSEAGVDFFSSVCKVYFQFQNKNFKKSFFKSMENMNLFHALEKIPEDLSCWDFLRDIDKNSLVALEGSVKQARLISEFIRAQRLLDIPILYYSDGLDHDDARLLSHVGVVDVGNVIWNESQVSLMFCEAVSEWITPRADDVVVQKAKQKALYQQGYETIYKCRFAGDIAHDAEGLLDVANDKDSQSATLGPEIPALRLIQKGDFAQAVHRLGSWDVNQMTCYHGCLLAWALFCQGQKKEAYSLLEKVIKSVPKGFLLPGIYKIVFDTLENQAGIERRIRETSSRKLYFHLLTEYTNVVSQSIDDIEKTWRSCLKSLPEEFLEDQISALYNLCLAFAKQQRWSQARREIKFALKIESPFLKKEMVSLDKRLEECMKTKKNFVPLVEKKKQYHSYFYGRFGCFRVFMDPVKTVSSQNMMKKRKPA